MSIKIHNKKFCDWDSDTKKLLRKANQREKGLMVPYVNTYPESETFVAFSYENGKKELAGWCLVIKTKKRKHHLLATYMKRKYRRKGIGTKIVKKVMSTHKNQRFMVYIGRESSESFYNNIRKENKYKSQINRRNGFPECWEL